MDETLTAPKPASGKGPVGIPVSRKPSGPYPVLRTIISVILVIVALGVGGEAFSVLANVKQPPPREEPVAPVLAVEAFVVEPAELRQFVTGFGTAWADREVVVSAEVSGRVTEVDNLKVGRSVSGPSQTASDAGPSIRREGDLICQIDPQTYEQRLKQVAAQLEQDKISEQLLAEQHATNLELQEQQKRRLATAEEELKRQEDLLKSNAGMIVNRDRAKQEVEQYRESLIRIQNELRLNPIRVGEVQTRKIGHDSDLRLAELELEKATVRAPFSGQLSQIFVEEGQYVRPGDKLVQVTDQARIEIPLPLPIREAALLEHLIKSGKSPEVDLCRREEDFRNPGAQHWTGRAMRVAPIADDRTRTVLVYVEVVNAEQTAPLRPGTFVHGRVQSGVVTAQAGLLIPREAIVDGGVYVAESPDGGAAEYVAKKRDLTILDPVQSFALVSAGIQPGDQVVMTNLDIIVEGSLLNVRKTMTLDDELLRLRVPALQRVDADPAQQPQP